MTTRLFAVASGLDANEVAATIPPRCFGEVHPAPPPRREGADTLMEWEWGVPGGARHLMPAFSALGERAGGFRFELAAQADGRWSPWLGAATIGPADFSPLPSEAPGLDVRIDQCLAGAPVERVRLRLRIGGDRAERLLARPWLVTLSASDLGPPDVPQPVGRARLDVPRLSQMAAGGPLAARICSPTSVAMVLAYWGVRADLAGLAAEMFHPTLDLYGVWPAAIAAAARHGVLGYLLRFPDWASAAWCLGRGLPLIASVRYAAGELTGAAMAETSGHLVVLTGWENDEVLVNDPAARSAAGVPRRYRLDELARVWLERSGVGYVLFRPASARV